MRKMLISKLTKEETIIKKRIDDTIKYLNIYRDKNISDKNRLNAMNKLLEIIYENKDEEFGILLMRFMKYADEDFFMKNITKNKTYIKIHKETKMAKYMLS